MSEDKEVISLMWPIMIALLGFFLGAVTHQTYGRILRPGELATACNQVEKGATWDGERCVVTVTRKAGE